jgi:hypothetical protein
MRAISMCIGLVLLVGCEEAPRETARMVQIVDERGGNPVADLGPGELRIEIDQGDAAQRQTIVAPYRGGTFDITSPIRDYGLPTRLGVEIESDDSLAHRIGAVPAFVPIFVGFARVVMGEPLRCAGLAQPRLPEERLDLALVSQGATLWAIGGTNRGASTDIPWSISAPQLTWADAIVDPTMIPGVAIDPFSPGLRESQAMLLGTTGAILVLEQSRAFMWRPGEGETPISLHDGAGSDSTLANLGNDGIAVVGGNDSAKISWVAINGTVSETRMTAERRSPAAAFVSGALVIAGGQEEGQSLIELAALGQDGVAIDAGGTSARVAPVLVRDDSRRMAALMGGQDASGEFVREVWLVRSCPACEIETLASEFDWAQPRLDSALVETLEGTWILGGMAADACPVGTPMCASRGADRVVVNADGVTFESMMLDVPRARASATELAQGIVVLLGGLDASGREVDHLTMCWPERLEPWD